MPVRPVVLRSELVLIPNAGRLRSQLDALAGRDGFPRSPYDMLADLGDLTAQGGIPVTLSEPLPGKTDWSVLAHTRSYLVRLFLTGKYKDAYSIGSISPLRLRDHQRLAQGYLLVRPRDWLMVDSTRDIPQGTVNGWDQLVQGWDELSAAMATTAPPTSQQDGFLRTLGEVVDATERITTSEDAGQSFPFREARPTAGTRSGATQLYELTLAGARAPEEGAFVQVAAGDGVRVRGQVTLADGMTVRVRFDEAIDWNDLRGQGEITTTTSTVVYRMQREAVSQFRSGRARNPGVLAALVDRYAPPPTPRQPPPRPEYPLNPRQGEAFAKTLAGPDLLAVIGPPGTGKTTTITEMVRAVAGSGERVIVCSQNNRAVDNILGRLPRELLAIRVGNEARVTDEGKPYLLQRQAAELRDQALAKTRGTLESYTGIDQAAAWTEDLARRNTALWTARDAEAQALAALAVARSAAGGPAAAEVDRLTEARAGIERQARTAAEIVARLGQRWDWGRARSGWVIIGWIFGMLARLWMAQLQVERPRAEGLGEDLRAADASLEAARRHLVEVTKHAPEVISAKAVADAAQVEAGQRREAARTAAGEATAALSPMGVTLPPPASSDAELQETERWLGTWLRLLSARRDLLAQWTDEAAGETGQLYQELIRYADVLAATCTGVGSRPELAQLDFDLAIVDEAGQIGLADALIPLARARRAVLVGDHMQLPPFLDSDVDAWGKLVGDPVVRGMLSKSALEMLVNALPPDSPNVVWLAEQRRMPEVIARFASAQFYGGQLRTPPGLRTHRPDLFTSAFTFIDTSDLEWPKRRDRSGRNRERWGQQGYDNPGEGRLLADLAIHYDHAGQDWAVIVPYLAQAELIRKLLTGHAGSAEKVRLNVGTVDSFQGGERDVILYGFTRSNPAYNIGFLRELRRVNVAITRVRQQLVLVGDLETLTSARDAGFRALARALRDYVVVQGESISHDEARLRLRAGGQAR
jgi:hypothetical protein